MAENETPSTEQTAGDTAAEAKPVLNRKLLSETIDIIRQSLQADGGDIALIDCTDDGVVTLEMQGACAGSRPMTCPRASSASSRSTCLASPACSLRFSRSGAAPCG